MAASGTLYAASAAKPNIIVLLADDLGYGDLSCQGATDFKTPHIDALARDGVRFTSGYSSCTVCSPSRAGLLTGRYQTRFGHEFNFSGEKNLPKSEIGLPASETTIATRLKAAGYRTGAVGKWHLGDSEDNHPQTRGFEEFFGFIGALHGYGTTPGQKNKLIRGISPASEQTYLTDVLAREGADFIRRHAREPFFLYLAFNAVHLPMEASPEYLARVPDIKDPKHRVHAAMTIALDDGVGRVMAALRAAGLEENTLVFFLSDNGGTSKGASSNRPLRGEKHTYWEGGIRVPWMLQWKGQVPAGKVIDAPVITLDMSATVLAVAGADLTATKLDGVNLLPFLRGESTTTPHETLFWRWGDHMAIRQGDWKLVKTADPKNTGRPSLQLYNLADDLGEKNNLSAANPGKLAELQAAWSAWNAEQAAPRWSDGDK